jgi:hypothetical protein
MTTFSSIIAPLAGNRLGYGYAEFVTKNVKYANHRKVQVDCGIFSEKNKQPEKNGFIPRYWQLDQ